MLRDSTAVAIVRTHPQAILLAMRKSLHGLPLIPYMVMGDSLGSPSGHRSSAINMCTCSISVG